MSFTGITKLGKFIVFEGIDGAGKSTAIESAKAFLNQKDIHSIVTREPGGTLVGEEIRRQMLHGELEYLPEAEVLLMFASRVHHLEEVIYPALQKGIWVLCDRFTDSTYAYQGGGGQVGSSSISRIEKIVQGAFEPDLVLYLDISVTEGLKRATGTDYFERNLQEFYERVRKVYLNRAVKSRLHKIIDASESIEEVHFNIITEVSELLKKHHG